MFSILFDDDSSPDGGSNETQRPSTSVPPLPRPGHGFCGILNQGATCYLNSLLQTLFLTPEFRDGLFALGSSELGRIEDKDKVSSKIRIIPIELQRLFIRMLHLNQAYASTTDLTEGFGWTNNEELQQHDVQELNRILFNAIEESLVGTSGQNLIKNLYHGTVVNQIICQECGRVSEVVEQFLDLTVTVAGNMGLENSLYNQYVEMERLDGKNQYRCAACNKLVDAKKGARIRHLPPILTFSLLRFSFDYFKLERYKENGKFTFPLSLDMSQYLEHDPVASDMEYELFSVVIHSGSAYGGHYHAYIRDVEGRGLWGPPEEEVIKLPKKKEEDIDLVQLDSPRNVLKALLENAPDKSLSVDLLSQELMKKTGVSWNKRFKKSHGTMTRFLQKHNDIFVFNESTRTVSLKSDLGVYGTQESSPDGSTGNKQDPWIMNRHNSRSKEPPPPGHLWFDFNDTHVHPIWPSDIEKQFSGRESGYMLFYRRKSYQPEVQESSVPQHLLEEVEKMNAQLEKEREDYERVLNRITVMILQADDYEYSPVTSALRPRNQEEPKQITLDRRKTMAELRQVVGELTSHDYSTIHTAKHLPAGVHLNNKLVCDSSTSIKDAGITNNEMLFFWDGEKVHNEVISAGVDCEPILLTVREGSSNKSERGFAKNLPLGALRCALAEEFGVEQIDLYRLTLEGNTPKSVLLSPDRDECTLNDLNLVNGSEILMSLSLGKQPDSVFNALGFSRATNQKPRFSRPSDVADVHEKMKSHMTLSVEVRYPEKDDNEYPTVKVEATPDDMTVEDLKALVISQLPQSQDIPGGGRFRVDDQHLGLQTPLRNDASLEKAGIIQTTHLVFEAGRPPASNEITVNIRLTQEGAGDVPDYEMIVDKGMTVQECLALAASKSGLNAHDWHLRQANWCGEAAAILDDIEMSLDLCNIRDGALLLLEEGRITPKGFYQLPVWLYPTPVSEQDSNGYIAWITNSMRGLMGGNQSNTSSEPISCGMVEITKDSLVGDLKSQIMTLPVLLANHDVPTNDFFRVRVIENGRLRNVLRENKQNIQRQKVSVNSHLGVQVLSQEESLGNNDVLLQIWERVPQNRSYTSRGDIVWDSSKDAPVSTLKQRIADHLTLPVEQISIAKYFEEKFEWMVIKDAPRGGKQTRGGKGRKKDIVKVNVKHAPYLIKEGDVIGVKNLAHDSMNEDDFTTAEDDEGKEKLKQIAEQKQRERQEKKAQFAGGKGLKIKRDRKKEVGLSIKVGDFR